MTLLAVMMPHREQDCFLGEAVASVLAQDFPHLELFLVDDASPTDAWLEAVAPHAADPRLRLFRTDRPVGPYRIKNCLLALLRDHTHVAFMDADDRCPPHRLRRLLGTMRWTGADLVGSAFRYLSPEGAPANTVRLAPPVNLAMAFGTRFPFLHPTTICTRRMLEELGGFDGTTTFAADFDFAVRARHRFRMWNTLACLYDYRRHADSLTQSAATGLASPARQAYEEAMWARDRERRRLRDTALSESLRARPNDVEFEMVEVEKLKCKK